MSSYISVDATGFTIGNQAIYGPDDMVRCKKNELTKFKRAAPRAEWSEEAGLFLSGTGDLYDDEGEWVRYSPWKNEFLSESEAIYQIYELNDDPYKVDELVKKLAGEYYEEDLNMDLDEFFNGPPTRGNNRATIGNSYVDTRGSSRGGRGSSRGGRGGRNASGHGRGGSSTGRGRRNSITGNITPSSKNVLSRSNRVGRSNHRHDAIVENTDHLDQVFEEREVVIKPKPRHVEPDVKTPTGQAMTIASSKGPSKTSPLEEQHKRFTDLEKTTKDMVREFKSIMGKYDKLIDTLIVSVKSQREDHGKLVKKVQSFNSRLETVTKQVATFDEKLTSLMDPPAEADVPENNNDNAVDDKGTANP